MRRLSRLWSGLEALPGLAGVLAEWRDVWGQDFDVGRAFLRPAGQLARAYPCPDPGGDGCPRRVVTHGDDDIVAVCGQTPKRCKTLTLTRADVVVYELNWKGLCFAVSGALGIAPLSRPARVSPGTVRIGHHPLATGNQGSVYLTIQHEVSAFSEAAGRLLARNELPFILLTPTAELCVGEGQGFLSRSDALMLSLDQALALDETGALRATESARGSLASFAAEATGRGSSARVTSRVRPVRLPEGALWENLRLTISGRRLTFLAVGEYGERDLTTAGFEDQRQRGNPNYVWELLRLFGKYGGRLPANAVDARRQRNLKQSISRLRACLRALFPTLPGKSIVKRAGETYHTVFRITATDRVVVPVPADTPWSDVSIVETRTGNIRFIIGVKQRYLVYADGRPAESSTSKEFQREVAERSGTEVHEHDFWELGLLEDDGQVSPMGEALLDVLRAGGRAKRGRSDESLIKLGGILCHVTGIEETAFDFRPERGEWIALFEASSEGRQR